MAIDPITQELSEFPPAPNRDQDQTTFTTNADNHVVALGVHVEECNVQVGQINTTVGQINTASDDITQSELNAAQSAADAQTAADSAAGGANNLGSWSALTGPLTVPASVNHNGSVWILNNNIADVTASEPTSANSDWTESSGGSTGWEDEVVTSITLEVNKKYSLDGSSSAIDATLPECVSGDFLIIHNQATSVNTVRFIVSGSVSVVGKDGTVYTATSNITMASGDSVSLACTDTANLWRVI